VNARGVDTSITMGEVVALILAERHKFGCRSCRRKTIAVDRLRTGGVVDCFLCGEKTANERRHILFKHIGPAYAHLRGVMTRKTCKKVPSPAMPPRSILRACFVEGETAFRYEDKRGLPPSEALDRLSKLTG